MPKIKKRTNVKDLPKTKQELTPDQSKRVKGGLVNDLSQDQQFQQSGKRQHGTAIIVKEWDSNTP